MDGRGTVAPPTRVGIIGAGSVARRHAATLRGFCDARVVAVADPVEEAAAELAARCGAAAYRGHEELLERHDLEALYVCVPPYAHGAPELAAIERGLPFFVEKPLAADLATAELIAAKVRERGLVTCTGYHWRWLDIVEEAAALARRHPPRLVLAYWLDKVAPPAWWTRRDRSGGQVVEQATHVLDLARLLVGEVRVVYALGAPMDWAAYPGADIDGASVASLRFDGGAVGSVSSTCLLDRLHRAGLHLIAEGMAIELSERELAVEGGGRQRTVRAAGGDARSRPDRDFLDAVRGRANRVRAPYEEALRTHRLACAVARSAQEGRPVELPGGPGGAPAGEGRAGHA